MTEEEYRAMRMLAEYQIQHWQEFLDKLEVLHGMPAGNVEELINSLEDYDNDYE